MVQLELTDCSPAGAAAFAGVYCGCGPFQNEGAKTQENV
jgi:hypothetical protein